jgi:hypothetical protein
MWGDRDTEAKSLLREAHVKGRLVALLVRELEDDGYAGYTLVIKAGWFCENGGEGGEEKGLLSEDLHFCELSRRQSSLLWECSKAAIQATEAHHQTFSMVGGDVDEEWRVRKGSGIGACDGDSYVGFQLLHIKCV